MKKNRDAKKIKILSISILLLPAIVYAAKVDYTQREEVMEETLYALEAKAQPSLEEQYPAPENISQQEAKGNIAWFSGDKCIKLSLKGGYIAGNTAYDYDHHTSELEFPLHNYMAGADVSLGWRNLAFNAECWMPVEENAGWRMKDKDWDTRGNMYSYTQSKAEMDALIWDANLEYDFYKGSIARNSIIEFFLPESNEIKIGTLLGYRYERFDYDMYGAYYDTDTLTGHQGQTLFSGQKVLSYKIKFYLPYVGLATEVSGKNYGFGVNAKYSVYPAAKDLDNHLLRGLTFYGDYDKHREAFLGNIYAFWKIAKDWKLSLGLDATMIRIDGRTWDETHNPAWDQDQATDTRQWLAYSGIEYKF